MITLIIILALAIVSGLGYWLGGQGADGVKAHPWIPAWFFDRNTRHFVCPSMAVIAVTVMGHWHWSLLLCWPIMAAATACYWNFLSPKADKTWWNWLLHGIGIGLSMLPWAYFTHQIIQTILYATLLGIAMSVWSVKTDDDFREESGRGFLIVAVLAAVLALLK